MRNTCTPFKRSLAILARSSVSNSCIMVHLTLRTSQFRQNSKVLRIRIPMRRCFSAGSFNVSGTVLYGLMMHFMTQLFFFFFFFFLALDGLGSVASCWCALYLTGMVILSLGYV